MFYETEYPTLYSRSNIALDIYNKPITWFKPMLNGLGDFFRYRFSIKSKDMAGSRILHKQIINMQNGSEIKVGINKVKNSKAVVLYLHTVAGNLSQYANFALKLEKCNVSYVSYTRSGNDNSLRCTNYNFLGDINELIIVIQYINAIFPGVPIHAIAASAGTTLLIRYLSKYNTNKHIKSSVLVSPGYDYVKSFTEMNTIPKSYLINKLKSTARNVLNDRFDANVIKQICSMDDWLEFQSKILNYHNVSQYIEDHNPCNFIEMVNVPTLCISSLDDSIFSGEVTKQFLHVPQKNSNISILTTKKGGHATFYDYGHDDPWVQRVIYEWIVNRINA